MGRETMKICQHCGASLPEEASFCPYCASAVNGRQRIVPPAPYRRRALRRTAKALAVLALIGIGAAVCYLAMRPRVYDAPGEIYYTDGDDTYQVVLAWPENRMQSVDTITQIAEINTAYRFPVRLYVNHADSDASANTRFLEKVAWAKAEFLPLEEGGGSVTCQEPVPSPDYARDAALVSLVDFVAEEDFTAQMVWTIRMTRGDTLRLRLNLEVEVIHTYTYTPEDVPMRTSEELQALVDKISASVEPESVVNICLPAVTYTGGLVVENRAMNFYGTTEGAKRTTFVAPVRLDVSVKQRGRGISYFENIDFQGDGDGVGLSTAANARATNCTFANWKTGVLGYGTAWVNVISCTFTGNETGFHFNSTGGSANHSLYNDNLFRDNEVAVLLENVPTELELNFQNSVFTGNRVDIDNRCSQATDISAAVFQ